MSIKTNNHANFGTIALRAPARKAGDTPMTVIVSGVGECGISLAAAVLSAMGVPMGQEASLDFNFSRLAQLVDARNAANERWGFKFESLQTHLLPAQLKFFRNPHLIIVTRDPVAIATQGEARGPEAYFNVTRQSHDLANFAAKAPCPVLLISHETFLAFPARTIDSIAAFCGMELAGEMRADAQKAIAHSNTDYLKMFQKEYKGHLNGIRHGRVFGWCCALNNQEPVAIELLADGKVVAAAFANSYREDLKKAGIWEGDHAFEIDISHLGLNDNCMLRVQAVGSDFVLEGSDARVAALRRQ